MARVKKVYTLDSIFFSTPEQKLLRLLLSEPGMALTTRTICSKLKGVRGLGGVDGVTQLLISFQELGLVDFVSNQRAVRIREDHPTVEVLKSFVPICELEGLKNALKPISAKGVLYGKRSMSAPHSEKGYDLFVVSGVPEEVKKTANRHPLGRSLELLVWTPDHYGEILQKDPSLFHKLSEGIVLWGASG